MDYSKFVDAVLEEDEEVLSGLVKIISAVLIKFLLVRYKVNKQDAEDCAQNTLLIAIEKIRADKLQNPDSIISYLFTTAKNEYFKLLSKEKETGFADPPDTHIAEPDQLYLLLDEEKLSILEKCMAALKPDFRSYIQYWFQNADAEAAVVAQYFGITVNNAWTKKHRVINLLKECYEKKIQL